MKNPVKVSTPEFVPLEFQTAHLGSRAVAALIDWALLIAVWIVLTVLGTVFTGLAAALGDPFWSSVVKGTLIVLLFAIPPGYFVLTEYFMRGQTVGKRIVGLRVVSDTGTAPGFLALLLRHLMHMVDMLPFFYLVGIVAIFSTKREQRLGDLVAGTMVVCETAASYSPSGADLVSGAGNPSADADGESGHPGVLRFSPDSVPLTEEQLRVLERFLLRREEMDPTHRERIAHKLVQHLFPNDPEAGEHPETILENAWKTIRVG